MKQKKEIKNISMFLDEVNKLKEKHSSYIILKIFIKIINCACSDTMFNVLNNIKKAWNNNDFKFFKLTDNELSYIKKLDNKNKIANIYKKKLTGFVEEICGILCIPIIIEERFSRLKNNNNINCNNYIEKISNLNLNELKNRFYYKDIVLAKFIVEVYYSLLKIFQKRQKEINVFNETIQKEDTIIMDAFDKNLLAEYKFEIFIRGLSTKNKNKTTEEELPSLFIENNNRLINNERLIYKDFLASNPDKFDNMTTFDILTKMRHYEVPSRLLDVTSDPLLALYFACGRYNYEEKCYTGSNTVLLYLVKDTNIKYYDSDTVTVLSVLSKLRRYHKEQLKKIVNVFKKSNNKYYSSKDEIGLTYVENKKIKKEIEFEFDKDRKRIIKMMIEKTELEFRYDKDLNKTRILYGGKEIDITKIKPSKKHTDKKATVKDFFNYFVSNVVGELNWQLKQEISGWHEGIFDLETFTQCYLVKPKKNNPRIIAQSGAFFIYPFDDTNIKSALIDSRIYKINTTKIKDELNLLNIKETKYMPDDLTKYAVEIREKYN